jgi:hypothetical protein
MCPCKPEIERDPSELVVKTCCCPVCCPFTVIVCWSEPGSIVTVIVLFCPSWMICSCDVLALAFGSAKIFKWLSCSCYKVYKENLPCIPFFNFFGVRFLKCLSSKCLRKLRDCLIVAEHIGHVAGCSDCDFDFGSKNVQVFFCWFLN